jgi:hypothetical protein
MDISFQILLEELLLQRITNMYPLHLAPKTLSMVTKELVHLNDQNNLFDHGIKTYSLESPSYKATPTQGRLSY